MEIEPEEFILLLAVFIAIGAVAGHLYWPQTEIVTVEVERLVEVPYFVEVPVVVVETDLQVIEIPTIIYQTNYTIIEVPILMPGDVDIIEIPVYLEVNKVQDFESLEELLAFINSDLTDELGYSSRFNCMDFAITTADNALKLGYRVLFLYEYNHETMKAHAPNMAYVKSEAKWIVWEPQTDEIQWGWISRVTDGVN